MGMESSTLLLNAQFALKLTQKKLGEMFGVTRRTILRWQDRGHPLNLQQATLLANALRPTHPDLADEAMAHGRRNGMLTLRPATPEELEAILLAAASAAPGLSPSTARVILQTAFASAAEQGFDANALAAALGGA